MEEQVQTPGAVFRNLEPLILASASPRRKELLQMMGVTFEVLPSDVEEAPTPGASPETQVERWAMQKAGAVSALRPDCWVLGADTIVVLEGRIFGKPESRQEAVSILQTLGGREHDVISAVCLTHHELRASRVRSVSTRVRFKTLSNAEIEAYVRTGEPLDKAGGYGIQGVGAFLVRSIEGSYTNVVGLPLCETLEDLIECGVIAAAGASTPGK